ncbi:Importin-5 [Sarcoptes scabiei]|nr:Importin-5 [Sarcoptes scabiei]UXI20451.1 DEP domain-containing protein 5 [Sarcoptes scabiei]
MDELTEFNQLLGNLLNTDTEIRQKSEKIYENIPLKNRIHLLFLITSDDTKAEEFRHFSAILLRRLLFKCSLTELSKHMDSNYLDQLKNSILVLIQKENLSIVLRRKISDIIAELAPKFIDDEKNQWPELMNFIYTAANSSNIELEECCLVILYTSPSIFCNEQSKCLDFIHKMLYKCATENTNDQVKLSSIKALTAFIQYNYEDKSILKSMDEPIMLVLQITNVLTDCDNEQPLLSLIELAEKCPMVLKKNFNPMMQLCMKLITNQEYSPKIRHSAIEIVVCFAENAPATFRKQGSSFFIPLVSQLLMMMTEIEYDEEWPQSEEDDDDDDSNESHIVGETALDRLACSLGGKIVFPLAINIISQMMNNAKWEQRNAALMAISCLGEGCKKQMIPLLDKIVTAVLPFCGDPHPRVRYSVCVALGQMASDFAPMFQQQFHDKFIPSMLHLLNDNQNPRVQAHAGAAFVNFFEEAKQKVVVNYANSIIDKFEEILKLKIDELMKNGKKLVLEQIVVSIASFADLFQGMFIEYYDRLMPYLKFIIENAVHKNLRLLRGKAIECASLMGFAVGSEKFCNDASQIMNLLLISQTGELVLEDDDPQLSYMITSWVRICKLLGPKFEPYLPMVMPQVLKTASMKVEMALIEGDLDQNCENDGDWKFFELNDDENFGIRVSSLDDKATACEMLVCYARELKHGFVNYLEETVKILVPLLKYYLHEGVRTAAAQSLPYLLECAKIRGESYLFEIWNYILPNLLAVLDKESEKDVLTDMLVSLSDCISTLGRSSFNEQQMEALIKILDFHFNELFQRFRERQEKRNDEDYDDEVEDTLNDEDDDDVFILTKLVDVLHSLFEAYGENFLPCFNLLLKHIVNLATSDKPVAYQQWAVCVVDDLIEFTGSKCVEYENFFLPLLVNNLKSQHAELRQAAAYGFGVLAKHGGKNFEKILSENVPTLMAIIQAPNSRNDENIYATENAISAITKIMEFNGGMVDIDSLLPCWLGWLPIWEDEEEVIHVYSFLYQLLERNHPLIIGHENCNVPHIVSIILEVFARTVIDHASDLGQKLISYIKFVNLDESITSKFSAEQQQALKQIANL